MTLQSEVDPLQVMAPLIELLEVQDLRWLLAELLGEMQTTVSGVGMLLVVDALRQCADDGGNPDTPDTYELWRLEQACPTDWPSARLILNSCERWAPALTLAGLAVPVGTRRQQQRNQTGFDREEAVAALRAWVDDTHPDSSTFGIYRTWAEQKMEDDPALILPADPRTFIKCFGTWDNAVTEAIPEIRQTENERTARETEARDEEVRSDLRGAAAALRWDVIVLSRPAYDDWAKRVRQLNTGRRPASSHTVQRRFGTWGNALLSAAA